MNGPRVLRGATLLVVLLVGLVLGGSASAGSGTLRMVPLVEHWDGSSWTQVDVAPPGGPLDELEAVVAPSATEVWAFGYTRYVQHWDGTVWQRVALPVPKGAQSPEFNGAAAISPNDIWAVGDAELHGSTSPARAIVDHWNGHRWRLVPVPPSGRYSRLVGVTALSATNVWAVGVVGVDSGRRVTERTLTVHWNGKVWKRVPSPNPATPYTPAGSIDDSLAAVAGDSSHDVWAVGQYYRVAATGDHAVHPLVLQWNGTRWRAVSSLDPSGPTHRSSLSGVVASSSTGVWAVGSAARYGTRWVQHALAEHWDGTRWHIVPTTDNPLTGASGLSANDVWAAGGMTGGDVTHWNGSAWTVQTKLVHDDALTAVAEVSPTDVWAVGVRFVY
jgi:hypothetical protein